VAEATRTRDAVIVETGTLGVSGHRPAERSFVLPIVEHGTGEVIGILISGLSPALRFDAAYRDFLTMVASQIGTAIVSARALEEAETRAAVLAEIDRAKTMFFSNVSHEFRTPLTLMLGPLEDLASDADLQPDVREQLAVVRRNAARLLRLVNTLLDFSRIEAGRAQACYEPGDLAEYTLHLASIFASATDRAGLRLTVDCPPVGQPVYVDRGMWERVVLNLVSNAFKFTFAGEIQVSLRRDAEHVSLIVADTGVGIPEAEIPKLFERFHRVAGVSGRSHEGSGIGLALINELVRLHGGTVRAESELGKGSRFTVSIPLGRAHLPGEHVRESVVSPFASANADVYVEEALQWLPAAESPPDAWPTLPESRDGSTRREHILIVDDSADMRDYIVRLLAPRWRVEVAANGRAALSAVAREQPDLIITDVMMPELDGVELLEALRRDPLTSDIPVLVLSARAGEEARLDGLKAGASDYLVKPFSGRELLARVEAQLLRARIRAVEEAHARRVTSVFAQAPAAIAMLRGPDHVFEMTNAAYLELVNQREVVGKPVRDALPEVRSQGLIDILDEVYRSKTPHIGRSLPLLVNRTADGNPEQRFFDLMYQPLVDEHGQTEGIAAVVYAVTELTRARQEAEIANRAKDAFLAMLGHELRNPLAPILTALQLLRLRGVQSGEREREVIERQVKHLVALVDDLLDVSRITRGKIQLHRTTFELSEAVARAIETASPLFEQKRHIVHIDVPQTGLTVDGDLQRLAQVVANLLTNAAKYTEDGGRVDIAATATDGEIVLRVRDSGIGIAPDTLPRIFDLFVQEHQAIDRAHGGLGLGLAIVRSLTELHGGRVEARSEGIGHGSEFILRLPRISEGTAAPVVAASEAPAAVPKAMHPCRVLVVDDNYDAAAMLVEALTLYGHTVRMAHDGVEALRTAEVFQPDVALVDIGLPVVDGYEVAQQLAQRPDLRGIRLIAVTGYGQEQDRNRSKDAGFSAHLVKPIDIDQLRELLESPSTLH
jgi:signal transduction histidine kinase/ActR/RegA family two-component response regulator